MPRFRAPSTSSASVATPARNTRAQSRKTCVTSCAYNRAKVRLAVEQAAKCDHKVKQLVESCIAYVGNIGPDVDENALIAHFSRYGNILSARIHCCGGVAMTVSTPPASYHQNMVVRQYAMVAFESKSARHTACREENIVNGNKLVVSVVVSDLPEVQENIYKRLDDYQSRLEPPDVRRAQRSAPRSLKLEPTVLLDPVYEKKGTAHKRFRVMGVSFQEGIM